MNDIPGVARLHARRSPDATSASSHPELVTGDSAVAPRRNVSIASINRSVASAASRRTLGLFIGVAVAALLSTMMFRTGVASPDGDIEKQKLARTCLQWHLAASAVVSRMLQSTRDADLAQVGDAVFRMRRARRNCEAGWVTLACQDYHSVAAGIPRYAMSNDVFPCARVAASND
jgi:hypothetical protein